jgi:ubiquinone/menaquinone biosynthesis C-methylase UbiE
MTAIGWRDRLEAFFELRARQICERPTVDDLCYIAGRNPILWSDTALLNDLKFSILDLLQVNQGSKVLEVGCAAGFLAKLIAPNVKKFVGIDLADAPLAVAKKLELPNADFLKADGEKLRFSNREFDGAFCYDVFSNFPTFSDGEPIIREMLRVVKPGGRVLVGSIPDESKMEILQEIAGKLAGGFTQMKERAPLTTLSRKPGSSRIRMLARYFRLLNNNPDRSIEISPEIVSYYFQKSDFLTLGEKLGVKTRVLEIHPLNPYFGTRFNVIFVAQ